MPRPGDPSPLDQTDSPFKSEAPVFLTYLFPIWVAVVSATLLVRRDEIRATTG